MPLANNASVVPLRPTPDEFDVEERRAYERCKVVESMDTWPLDAGAEAFRPVLQPTIAARVLGWALVFAPSDAGRQNVARHILSCGDDLELFAGFAHLIVFGLVRVFYKTDDQAPELSISESQQDAIHQNAEELAELLGKPNKSATELCTLASFRDDHTCPLTGAVDSVYGWTHMPDAIGHTIIIALTEVAHIISPSTFAVQRVGGTSAAVDAKFEWAKSAAEILACFAGFNAEDVLGSDGVHSARNAFTVAVDMHCMFDNLYIWLEPVEGAEDTYTIAVPVKASPSAVFGRTLPPHVVFRSRAIPGSGGHTIPPPHPQLIALHAACARVAHMSGAAEYIDEIFREMEPVDDMTSPF